MASHPHVGVSQAQADAMKHAQQSKSGVKLQLKARRYTLWNKLGATLANSTNQPQGSEDALEAYHNALEIKPNFARALSNLGISFSNRGIFQDAASCYLRVLNMNPQASHIWSYLRGCFTQMNRYDLVEKLQPQV